MAFGRDNEVGVHLKSTADTRGFSQMKAQQAAFARSSQAQQRAYERATKSSMHRTGTGAAASLAAGMNAGSRQVHQAGNQLVSRMQKHAVRIGGVFQQMGFQANLAGGMMTRALTLPVAAAVGLGTAVGVKLAARLEAARASLGALLPAGYNVEALIKRLRETAIKSPVFNTPELVDFTRKLVASGIEVGKSERIIKSLGKVFQTFGVSGDAANLALRGVTQAFSKGKLQAEELTGQIGEQIPALALLARAAGKTQAEFLKMVSEGKITSEVFSDLLIKIGEFPEINRGATKSLNTMQGAWDRLKESIFDALAMTWLKYSPQIQKSLKDIEKQIPNVLEAFAPLVPRMVDGFLAVVRTVIRVVAWYNNLDDSMKKIVQTLGAVAFAAGPVIKIFGSLNTLAGFVAAGFNAILTPVGLLVLGLGSLVAIGVTKWLSEIKDTSAGLGGFFDRFNKGWDSVGQKASGFAGHLRTAKTDFGDLGKKSQGVLRTMQTDFGDTASKASGLGGTFRSLGRDFNNLPVEKPKDGIEELGKKTRLLWTSVKDKLMPELGELWDHLKTDLNPAFGDLSEKLSGDDGVIAGMTKLSDTVAKYLDENGAELANSFKNTSDSAKQAAENTKDLNEQLDKHGKTQDYINRKTEGWNINWGNFFDSVGKGLIGFTGNLKEAFTDIGFGVFGGLTALERFTIETPARLIAAVTTGNWKALKNAWEDWGEDAKNIFIGLGNTIRGILEIGMDVDKWEKNIGDWWEQYRKDFNKEFKIDNWFSSVGKDIGDWWKQFRKDFNKEFKVDDWINDVKEKFNQWWDGVTDWWNNLTDTDAWPDFSQIGQDIVQGLINGMIEIDIKKEIIERVFRPMVDDVKEFLGIKSPSTVFMQIGRDVIEGLIRGALEKWNDKRNSLKAIWDSIKGQASSAFAGLGGIASQGMQGARNAVSISISAIRGSFQKGWQAITSATKATWTTLSSTISSSWNSARTTTSSSLGTIRSSISNAWGSALSSTRSMWDKILGVVSSRWTAVKNSIQRTWRGPGGIKSILDAFGNHVRKTVPSLVSAGVHAIGTAFNRVMRGAANPINWVITNVINNGLRNAFNTISRWLHLGLSLGKVPNITVGGVGISQRNRRERGGFVDTPLGIFQKPTVLVGEGNTNAPEYVIPTDPKYRPRAMKLYESLGAQLMATGGKIEGRSAPRKRKPGIPMMAAGGIISGDGFGIGPSIMNPIRSGLQNFLLKPLGKLKGKPDAPIWKAAKGLPREVVNRAWPIAARALPKAGFEQLLAAAKGLGLSNIVSQLQALLMPSGGFGLGSDNRNSISAIMAMARRFNPAARLSSGYRPGERTYHGRGLAADIIGGGASGMARTARGFYGISGRLLELIHSGGGGYFVKHGRRVGASYYRSILGQHYSHVHVAARRDGLAGAGRVSGSLASWVRQAMGLTNAPASWFAPLVALALHESGGRPNAINLWDSNARRGTPSKGLFQTIDSTFRRHALPGLGNIWNPVHNGAAAIRYIRSRYGSIFKIPSYRSGNRFVGGYATGTPFVPETGTALVHRGERIMSASLNRQLGHKLESFAKVQGGVGMSRGSSSRARGSIDGTTVNITINGSLISQDKLEDVIAKTFDNLRRKGRAK